MFRTIDTCFIGMLSHSIDMRVMCNESWPMVEFIHLLFVPEEFMLHYHCCNCQDCQNYVVIHWIYIDCYSLIKFGYKIMQFSDVTLVMIMLCCAILQTQWLMRSPGMLDICTVGISFYELKKAFDCKLMQHLLYTAFPVFAMQTFLILGIIMILLMKDVRIWIDIIGYYNYYTFCWNYIYYIITHQVLFFIFEAIKICDNLIEIDKFVFILIKETTIDNIASHITMITIMLQEITHVCSSLVYYCVF